MGVTIKQIAEMAGVHRSTVDKVLHHRPGVSDPVRKRVQQIIDECGYEANPIGKALQMQDRELHIKVILQEVDARSYLKKGIEEALKEFGSFHIKTEFAVTASSDVEEQARMLMLCETDGTDGIILSPVNAAEIVEAIDRCAAKKIPVVTVNTDIKGSQRLCFIGQNGFRAGRVAGRFMGEFLRGAGDVVIFTSDGDNHQSFPFGTREDGFLEVLEESFPGICVTKVVQTKEKTQVIRREMRKICEGKKMPDGIFITCGGVAAIGDVLQEYEKQGVKVVCFESYPEILQLLREDVVTVTLDSEIEEQGKKAVEVLMDFEVYGRRPERKHLYSETRILVRESLG
mgnify:CR=1 FL=1